MTAREKQRERDKERDRERERERAVCVSVHFVCTDAIHHGMCDELLMQT